jgi:hypothetical protein
MLNKLKTRNLAIIFVVLLAVVIFYKISTMNGYRTFNSQIVLVDVEEITNLQYSLKADETAYNIQRKGDVWNVLVGNKAYMADTAAITQALSQLANLQAKHIAAKSEEKWEDFQVTDSLGTRVKLLNNDEVLADFYIGRFSYQQPQNPYQRQGQMTTYIRLAGKSEVYAVDGFLSMLFQKNASNYRNRKLVSINEEEIMGVDFIYSDSSFSINRKEGNWFIDENPVDSSKLENYFKSIINLTGSAFKDDIDITGKKASHQLKIKVADKEPVEIKVFAFNEGEQVVTSSMNEAVFSTNEAQFNRVFKSKGYFFVK